MAVLMPITAPAESSSGPPELPGLSGAVCWMTLSIRRPFCPRSERPVALTMPAVTVDSKPSGLPIAIGELTRVDRPRDLEAHEGQRAALGAQQREVGGRIAADELRAQLAPVGQHHAQLRARARPRGRS